MAMAEKTIQVEINRESSAQFANHADFCVGTGRMGLALHVRLPLEGRCVLMTERVDEQTCNPLKAWHDMGEPASLTARQLAFLRQSAVPLAQTQPLDGADFSLTLAENAVVRFRVAPVQGTSDFGYDYGWYVEHR